LFYLQEDNSLDIVGQTDVSEQEMRALINQRSVVVAKFLDKGRYWHCFLHTYRGILGKEIDNSPHIHYIISSGLETK
jgi:hypothetical protein